MSTFAQEGIQFEHSNWQEAKAKAIKEKKLIFIDFYTQWCGPCLNMAENIFTLGSVGNFYNTNFLNLKIDAETEEGAMLAKKYHVASYPTFVFVDPKTEDAIHVSGSNQDKEAFMFTGQSALDPEKTSVYLTAQKKAGNEKPEFLLNYANYQASRYNRDEARLCTEKLLTLPGYSLENPQVWALFDKYISGRDNGIFKELSNNTSKYVATHGQAAVDKKFFKELSYCPDLKEFEKVPEFHGKQFLIQKNKAEQFIKAEEFEKAAAIIDQMMENPGEFKEELCMYFRFMSRGALYNEYPKFWQDKCLSYAQYTAYNMPNRDEAITHFDYANHLEKYLKSIPEIQQYLPEFLSKEPKSGAKEYSMRPAVLKQKPTKKK